MWEEESKEKDMWEQPFLSTDVYHLVQWFLIYSILGWMVESIYMSLCNRKITNRGFIRGPICPIYGVGAVTVYLILKPLAGNYVVLYFAGVILATSIEYFTAIVMKRILGEVWWDYSEKPFNFKGILCLESSVAWGFYTLGLFLFLQRFVEMIVRSYSQETGKILAIGLILYYAVDFAYQIYKIKRNPMETVSLSQG